MHTVRLRGGDPRDAFPHRTSSFPNLPSSGASALRYQSVTSSLEVSAHRSPHPYITLNIVASR